MGGFIAFLLVSVCASAGDLSYVVLNGGCHGGTGLVRVSADGKSIQPIANVSGHGLAVDKNGDFIIAAVESLVRVTRSGTVSQITRAPLGSRWHDVLVDGAGDFILADNVKHAVWRYSAQSGRAVKIANYPVKRATELESTGLAMMGDDFLLIEENVSTELFRVSARGDVQAVILRGDTIPHGARIIQDGKGGYLVSSLKNQVFRLSQFGEATLLATIPLQNATGLARNPATGEIVVASNLQPALFRMKADGSSVETLAVDRQRLGCPASVIVDGSK